MTVTQIILGVAIFIVLAGGAMVIGYAMNHAARKEKPRLFLIGVVVAIAGAVLGYIAVDIFLILEGRSR